MSTSSKQAEADNRGRTSEAENPDQGISAVLSTMARSLQDLPDMTQTLQGVVDAAVHNIQGADYAGITQYIDGVPETTASTDPVVARVDAIQYEVGQGPCLQAITRQATVSSADLHDESRWPAFATRTADLGIRSMMAFQLFVRARDVGALNLYAREAGAFSAEDEQIGLLLASHAAVALAGAQEVGELHAALITRDIIGQAKGILMERYRLTGPAAFQLLVTASQNTNTKLRDIAESIATTGNADVATGRTG